MPGERNAEIDWLHRDSTPKPWGGIQDSRRTPPRLDPELKRRSLSAIPPIFQYFNAFENLVGNDRQESRSDSQSPRDHFTRALGCVSVLKRRKTGRTPVLMVGAWVRAPSIGRSEPPGAACLAARSATAYAACLGSGSAAKTLARACIGRLSEPAGTGRARWLWRLAGSCCAEVLPITIAEADRALGPMLPSSARELWPFFVLRDPRHAALTDEPGLP